MIKPVSLRNTRPRQQKWNSLNEARGEHAKASVFVQYKTQLIEMEQRLNETKREHAKAGEFVIQDPVNRNGTA